MEGMPRAKKRPASSADKDDGTKRSREADETLHSVDPIASTTTAASFSSGALPASVIASSVYQRLFRHRMTEGQLRQFNCPRPDPDRPGHIRPLADRYGFTDGHCERCNKAFDKTFGSKETCRYHLKNSRMYNRHDCCSGLHGSTGCQKAESHVHKGNLYLDLSGYRQTSATPPKPDGDYGIYAIDTESVHTKKGREVARVTLIDRKCHVAYETFCLPTEEMIDYNTYWSGITQRDLEGVTKTLADVQDELLDLISDKTILIGHNVGSDLIAVKLIHSMAVDTQVLYPHKNGLPYKLSLKVLAKTKLGRIIQRGAAGHDSHEDAEVCMKLALMKV